MKINLNNPQDFTKENLKKLIASKDDSVNTQFRITKKGILFLSERVGNADLKEIIFRLETNSRGNGYVGIKAAKHEEWVDRIFKVIMENWPNPKNSYCDIF